MEKILISACLIGDNCKYDGGNNQVDWIERLSKYYDLIPFCPEVEGGLPTPRKPSEIKNGIVFNKEGKDVTSFFNNGALRALNVCKHAGITLAILKENSPSCGVRSVYDGYFRNRLIKGKGITAALLEASGIKCISENEVGTFLDNLDHQKDEQVKGRERKVAEDKANNVTGFTVPKEEPKEDFKKKKSFVKKEVESSKEESSEKKPFRKSGFKKDFRKDGDRKFSRDRKPFRKDFKKDDEGFSKPRRSFRKDFHKDGDNFSKDKKHFKKSGFKKDFKKDGEKSFRGDKKFSKRFKSDKPFRKSSKPYGSKRNFSKKDK